MTSPRHEFTEAQKAEIFVRDRALCGYSGISLWLADAGASPASVDWVDHIKPAACGGRAGLANGVCASFPYNWAKRHGTSGVLLFIAGRPNSDYYTLYGALRPEIVEHLRRFARLHPSDWYLNRALFQVRKGAAGRSTRRRDGAKFTRTVDYYAESALRYLDRWRRLAEGTPSPRSRGLLPTRPTADQRLLLDALEATSVAQMKRVARAVEEWLVPSWDAMELIATVTSKATRRELAAAVAAHPTVTRSVKRAVKWNLASLDFED